MLFTTILLCCGITQARLSDWTIILHKNSPKLTLKSNPKINIELDVLSQGYKLLAEKKYKHLRLIQYGAGAAGTFTIVEAFRTAVYNTKTKKFLGEFPHKYVQQNRPKGTPPLTQPQWIFHKNTLRVIDNNTNLDVSLSF
jgi:hypothetical protein